GPPRRAGCSRREPCQSEGRGPPPPDARPPRGPLHSQTPHMVQRATVPRGRHAPPLEVRLSVQRGRLFKAAADVFARVGYADATAEAIAREAGMSKATFYEHFANKEECILALFDEGATEVMRTR